MITCYGVPPEILHPVPSGGACPATLGNISLVHSEMCEWHAQQSETCLAQCPRRLSLDFGNQLTLLGSFGSWACLETLQIAPSSHVAYLTLPPSLAKLSMPLELIPGVMADWIVWSAARLACKNSMSSAGGS